MTKPSEPQRRKLPPAKTEATRRYVEAVKKGLEKVKPTWQERFDDIFIYRAFKIVGQGESSVIASQQDYKPLTHENVKAFIAKLLAEKEEDCSNLIALGGGEGVGIKFINKLEQEARRELIQRVKDHKNNPNLSPAKQRDANYMIDYILDDLATYEKEEK